MKAKSGPLLVAIAGGSGAGKSWLGDQLQALLGPAAARLSLDDFYRDRSHLPAARRARINFDHPRAIDWVSVGKVLRDCLAGRRAQAPVYDFKNHSRLARSRIIYPRPVILMDGLWLFSRPELRRLFTLRIFVECEAELRLKRRLARDLLLRGREEVSIRRQFLETVEPMHRRYVSPQARWANLVLRAPVSRKEVIWLAGQLESRMKEQHTADGSERV